MLNRDMDSRLHARSIPLVDGVFDDGTSCGRVGAPGLRGKYTYALRQGDNILADISARFVQFREVLLAIEGKADASGWAADISLCA